MGAISFTGPRRATALGVASLPKAPAVGEAAFAAQLGRVLAARKALVMERSVPRRLDAVDVLVLDGTALGSGRSVLSDLVPLPDTGAAGAAERAFALFDPRDPMAVRRDGEWAIGPIDLLDPQGRRSTREQRELAGHAGVLGLTKGRRLQAVLAVDVETPPAVDALASAARAAGLRVVVATDRDHPPVRFADHVVPSGTGLVGAVRELQGDGHVVLLVSDNRRALGASDCGVGVQPGRWPAAVGRARRRPGPRRGRAAGGGGAGGAAGQPGRDHARPGGWRHRCGQRVEHPWSRAGPQRGTGGRRRGAIAFVDGVWRAKRLPGSRAVVTPATAQP